MVESARLSSLSEQLVAIGFERIAQKAPIVLRNSQFARELAFSAPETWQSRCRGIARS